MSKRDLFAVASSANSCLVSVPGLKKNNNCLIKKKKKGPAHLQISQQSSWHLSTFPACAYPEQISTGEGGA